MPPTTPAVTNPFSGMSRITPPQGERQPLSGQKVEPLPLHPEVVSSPPITPESIPRRALPQEKQEKAAPVVAAAPVVPGREVPPLWFQTAVPWDDGWSYGRKVCWLLHRFPHADVEKAWSAAGPFAETRQDYERLVSEHLLVQKLAAILPASAPLAQPSSPDPDEASPEELEAAHAPVEKSLVSLTDGTYFADQAALAPVVSEPVADEEVHVQPRLTAARKETITRMAREGGGHSAEAIAKKLGLPLELVRRGMPADPVLTLASGMKVVVKDFTMQPLPATPLTAVQAEEAYARPEEMQATLDARRALVEEPRAALDFASFRRLRGLLERLGLADDDNEHTVRDELEMLRRELFWALEVLEK